MSAKHSISEQLSHVALGEQMFPFGERTVSIRYVKTSSGHMFGAALDIATALAGNEQLNTSKTMANKLKSLDIMYEQTLEDVLNKVGATPLYSICTSMCIGNLVPCTSVMFLLTFLFIQRVIPQAAMDSSTWLGTSK